MSSYKIDRSRWATMNVCEQMGNIGSEVGRTIKAWRSGDKVRFDGALCRSLDLFDATEEVMITQKSPRIREVLIAREQFLNLFFNQAPAGDDQKIERYFMHYALAARINR